MIIDLTQTKVERKLGTLGTSNIQQELKKYCNSLRTRGSDGRYPDDFNEVLGDFVPCSKCYTNFDMFSFGLRPKEVFLLWEKYADPNCDRCYGSGYNRLAAGESDD